MLLADFAYCLLSPHPAIVMVASNAEYYGHEEEEMVSLQQSTSPGAAVQPPGASSLAAVGPEKPCPGCGKHNVQVARFCTNCGTPLQRPQPREPSAPLWRSDSPHHLSYPALVQSAPRPKKLWFPSLVSIARHFLMKRFIGSLIGHVEKTTIEKGDESKKTIADEDSQARDDHSRLIVVGGLDTALESESTSSQSDGTEATNNTASSFQLTPFRGEGLRPTSSLAGMDDMPPSSQLIFEPELLPLEMEALFVQSHYQDFFFCLYTPVLRQGDLLFVLKTVSDQFSPRELPSLVVANGYCWLIDTTALAPQIQHQFLLHELSPLPLKVDTIGDRMLPLSVNDLKQTSSDMSQSLRDGTHRRRKTGRRDRNGKEIREGDVVKITPEQDTIGVVEYLEPHFCISIPLEKDASSALIWQNWSQDVEIIGNVDDHPELLSQ
jgi:hypothetical protein